MRRFASESRMPCHEIRKGLDLARRFHEAYTGHGSGDLCQLAGHSEDQIGLRDGKDCWHEKLKTNRSTSLGMVNLSSGTARLTAHPLPVGALSITATDS